MAKRPKIPVRNQEPPRLQELGGVALGPREALALLKSLQAPIASVEAMIGESISGRYLGV